VNAFELSKRFVLEATDADLARVIRGLRRRGIALAAQGTPLLPSTDCGIGIEGYGPANDMRAVALRLRKFGANLDYVVFDEPLYYGHAFNGSASARACHAPIRLLAEQAAKKISEVREVFPAVQVGGTEPVGIPDVNASDWTADLQEWLEDYAVAAHAPLAFLRADVVWTHPLWRVQLQGMVKSLQSMAVPLGIIYNGSATSMTDEEWATTAARNAVIIEQELGISPVQVAFQSWLDYPRRLLPETRPGTMTNLILWYVHGLGR
jgi:hypothetical protein